MRCSALLLSIFAVLLLVAHARAVAGTLGQGVAVQAATATTINYAGTTQLVITTDVATTVTLSLVVNTAFTLDATLNQYTLGSLASSTTSIGYQLAVTNNANIQSATITSDALSTTFLASLTGNVAGVLYYDATAKGYLEIPPTITVSQASFSAPFQGSYVFVVRASTQPAAALFNRAVTIAANTQSQIQLQSTTTTRLVITQTTTANSQFTATESASAPGGSNTNGLVRISNFFDLQSSVSTGINSNLQYTYTAADEAKVDVRKLAWYYYNTASSSWDLDGSSSVDVNARVVTHASSHFSTWMVAGTSAASTSGAISLPALLLLIAALLGALMA